MIETYRFLAPDFQKEEPKELALLSIIAQSFFQPFTTEDNLLVILTALTCGSGIGFNRALLFRTDGDCLRGELWLGPESAEEARLIWEVLSTPGIGYVEIIDHNRSLLKRGGGSLSERARGLSYFLSAEIPLLPALSAIKREVTHVREAGQEPLVDPGFLEILGVEEFVCVPLFARDEVLGVIVVDNAITRKPISAKDIQLASLCGLIAGNYIYASTLNKKMLDLERMAALGEMTVFMTHQLRNPVTAIGGFTDQLLHSPPDESRTRRNLEIIRREIRRLENVLYKLAHFLQADMRRPQPFDLAAVLSGVLEAPDLRVRSESYELSLAIDEGLPPVLGDAVSVGEAVRNLLDNAFDATPAGGRIEVRGRRDKGAGVVLEVRDSGAGLTSEVRSNLFKPFFSTKNRGLGLGLLYVKRVLEACGGWVEAESSEPGAGTLFRLHFRSAPEGRIEG